MCGNHQRKCANRDRDVSWRVSCKEGRGKNSAAPPQQSMLFGLQTPLHRVRTNGRRDLLPLLCAVRSNMLSRLVTCTHRCVFFVSADQRAGEAGKHPNVGCDVQTCTVLFPDAFSLFKYRFSTGMITGFGFSSVNIGKELEERRRRSTEARTVLRARKTKHLSVTSVCTCVDRGSTQR